MAGVYIPGIDIPTEKPVAILLCTGRSVGLYDVVAGQLRHIRECEPAIPVPDHGRLVDADALLDAWDDRHTIPSKAAKVIEKTVIPADKEGEA